MYKYLKPTALLLIIIGGINWLTIGLFNCNLLNYILGQCCATLENMIYMLVGISALFSISLFLNICKNMCEKKNNKNIINKKK